jgi:hypothetical protein
MAEAPLISGGGVVALKREAMGVNPQRRRRQEVSVESLWE